MENVAMDTPRAADVALGERIRDWREARGYSREEFSKRMRERIGKGWSHVAVWQVEKGEKPCRTADLFAAADVLGVTVADLLAMPEEVDLGGTVVRADALAAGPSRMPEVEGMARLRDAAAALTTVRNGWSQYLDAVGVVRRLVGEFPALRDQVQAYADDEGERAASELNETVADDMAHAALLAREGNPVPRSPFTEPNRLGVLLANASPAMVAAEDVLSPRALRSNIWRPERDATGNGIDLRVQTEARR
ncbi:helix-turn-helix domain-containing protein [Microbacterium sp. MC2]